MTGLVLISNNKDERDVTCETKTNTREHNQIEKLI